MSGHRVWHLWILLPNRKSNCPVHCVRHGVGKSFTAHVPLGWAFDLFRFAYVSLAGDPENSNSEYDAGRGGLVGKEEEDAE